MTEKIVLENRIISTSKPCTWKKKPLRGKIHEKVIRVSSAGAIVNLFNNQLQLQQVGS